MPCSRRTEGHYIGLVHHGVSDPTISARLEIHWFMGEVASEVSMLPNGVGRNWLDVSPQRTPKGGSYL
jgi:hypothetical protein